MTSKVCRRTERVNDLMKMQIVLVMVTMTYYNISLVHFITIKVFIDLNHYIIIYRCWHGIHLAGHLLVLREYCDMCVGPES